MMGVKTPSIQKIADPTHWSFEVKTKIFTGVFDISTHWENIDIDKVIQKDIDINIDKRILNNIIIDIDIDTRKSYGIFSFSLNAQRIEIHYDLI